MTLAWVQGGNGGEPRKHAFVFVINGLVVFKTVDGLKTYMKSLPKTSTLTWAPGGRRMGGEPLLDSVEEINAFKEHSATCGVQFILVPAG